VPAEGRSLGPTGSGAPVVQFHGSGGSGCDCRAGGGSGAGLALLIAAVLLGLRRRRADALVLFLLALAGPGCSCGSEEVECNGPSGECMEGEVARGPTGRWNSLDMDGDRRVLRARGAQVTRRSLQTPCRLSSCVDRTAP